MWNIGTEEEHKKETPQGVWLNEKVLFGFLVAHK